MEVVESVLEESKLMIGEENVRELHYFPTLIFKFDVPNAERINSELVTSIYKERDNNKSGIQRSNFTALGGWHSHNSLHRENEFKVIKEHVDSAGEIISKRLQYHTSHALHIGSMWSIINPPGSMNRDHIHPDSLWSGVYYVSGPKDSGNIEFVDPRTSHIMHQPKYIPNKKRQKQCWTKVNFKPVPGTMIIFPGWLYHSVGLNESQEQGSDGDRVIISFNLSQRKLFHNRELP